MIIMSHIIFSLSVCVRKNCGNKTLPDIKNKKILCKKKHQSLRCGKKDFRRKNSKCAKNWIFFPAGNLKKAHQARPSTWTPTWPRPRAGARHFRRRHLHFRWRHCYFRWRHYYFRRRQSCRRGSRQTCPGRRRRLCLKIWN